MAFIKGNLPLLGSLPRFKSIIEKGINDHPWITCFKEDMGNGKIPKVLGLFNSFEVSLFITDPEMMNEIYVTKNKYFDKHDFLAKSFLPLVGNTMLF